MGIIKKQLLFNGGRKDNEVGDITEEESESESEEEEVVLAEPSKNRVYNKDGLLEKLGDISWPENLDFIHKLSVDFDQEQEVDVNDDLARELAFYTQALEGTRQAFEKLQSMGLPFLRPPDYYAEMVKTDNHMEKVKGRLLVEKKRIEEAEERRKAREAKRIAKEVHAQKLKERSKQKKDQIESVKKWRKQRKQSGFADDGKDDSELGLDFEDGKAFERSKKRRPGVAPGDRSGGRARQVGKKGMDKSRKGKGFKDSKFGFGGKKGMKKQNTAETTNDFRQFNKGDFTGNKKRKR
ncbi:probable rRNA-processing protein EBP2 homolog [Magnolia sinica]|uniref:probable rRNA-processing protein EBP2 homolog n=1 Tax=Magnolia sinica TaxID=86752 RepID=UPI00265A1CFF|nr:probable rRNA-processing protein EBP2 homolog [Magnolia sinica]XP_058085383.1 probable rRNA-processing protein EBP2 homolog [Magnolia sinica]XP_058085384.1 probable rRNA-processing protein EBP2 homolog [Magnolia sinica]